MFVLTRAYFQIHFFVYSCSSMYLFLCSYLLKHISKSNPLSMLAQACIHPYAHARLIICSNFILEFMLAKNISSKLKFHDYSSTFLNLFYCSCSLKYVFKFIFRCMLAQAYLSMAFLLFILAQGCIHYCIHAHWAYLPSHFFIHACSNMYSFLCLCLLKHILKLILLFDAYSSISSNSFLYLLKHVSKLWLKNIVEEEFYMHKIWWMHMYKYKLQILNKSL